MKTGYFNLKKISLYSLWGVLGCLGVSCSSYQNTSAYDNDGIYGSVPHDGNNQPVYTYNDGTVTEYRDGEVAGQNPNGYAAYFNSLEDEYPIITDVDNYTSYDGTDTIARAPISTYSSWGEDPDDVTVNVYGGYGYGGFGGWGYPYYGYGYYGGYYPWYGGYGYGAGWGLNVGWGLGYNSWGLGWGGWPGYYGGWGYPYGYGWNYPYYGGHNHYYYGNNYGRSTAYYNGGRSQNYNNGRYTTGRRSTNYVSGRSAVNRSTRFSNRSTNAVRTRGTTPQYNGRSRSTYSNSSRTSRTRTYAPSNSRNTTPSRTYSPSTRSSSPSRSSGRSISTPSRSSGSFGGGSRGGGGGGGSRGGGGGRRG